LIRQKGRQRQDDEVASITIPQNLGRNHENAEGVQTREGE
jgi:hypothetical protein